MAVRLEAIEDVDVISADDAVARFVQAKHHLDDYTLTDRSAELWTTLTAWMDLQRDLGGSPLPNLQLATTSTVAADTGVALLRPEGRNVKSARTSLLTVAKEAGAEGTRAARKRFVDLGVATQLRLLHAATILDASERVTALDDRLRTALEVRREPVHAPIVRQ